MMIEVEVDNAKVLVGAVLVRAALDAIRGKDPGFGDKTFSDYHTRMARAWFGIGKDRPNLEENAGDWFTFADCCNYLDICPYAVHSQITAIIKSQAKGNGRKKMGAGIYVSVIRRLILGDDSDHGGSLPAFING